MNLYDTLSNTLLERDGDLTPTIPKTQLSPEVFVFPEDGTAPLIHDRIRAQILITGQKLSAIVPVSSMHVVDSILLPGYSRQTPIHLFVEVDPEQMNNISSAEVLYQAKRLSNQLASGTLHPIKITLHSSKPDDKQFRAIYNIGDERWEKTPDTTSGLVAEWLSQLRETLASVDSRTGQVLRFALDFKQIKRSPKPDIRAFTKKIEDLLHSIDTQLSHMELSDREAHIKKLLDSQQYTLSDVSTYSNSGKIRPDISTMLYHKYYYQRIIRRLFEILHNQDNDLFDIKGLVSKSDTGKAFLRA